MKKVCILLLLLSLCSYFSQGVLAGEEVVKPIISRTWEEFSNPETLIDIKHFLDEGYQAAFWRQVGKINSQSKTSPAKVDCPAYWAQLGARYLGWHLELRKDFLFNSDDGLSGQSDFYVVSLIDNPKNDFFLNRLKETKFQEKVCSSTVFEIVNGINRDLAFLDVLGDEGELLAVAYDPNTNQLRVDKRVLLPPGIWMVLFNHQERHVADDVCLNMNKVITNIEALIELDSAAIADEIHTWKMFRENFLKIWKNKGLDFKPEYILAKMCLVDILLAEPLFETDFKNKKLECLKERSRKLFLR